MRFLLKTLLVTCGIAAAVLLWWRPAAELISMEPVDWAVEYEKQHTPAEHMWGAMDFAQEITRSSAPHQPLTEFIHARAKDSMLRVEGDEWEEWYARHFEDQRGPEWTHAYLSSDDPDMKNVKDWQGYMEIRGDGAIHHLHYIRLDAGDMNRPDIPHGLRFPQRTQALVVLAVTLFFWAVNRFRQEAQDLVGKSSAGKGCKVFVAVLVVGIALIILPFLYYNGQEGMPSIFIGGIVLIAGGIGLIMFGLQTATLGNMIRGKDLLAHWNYHPEEWRQFTELTFSTEKSEKRGLLVFVSAIILVIGGGFWLIVRDEAAAWVFLFLLGLIVLLWLIVLIVPRLAYRRNLKGPGEVYVGASGIYLNGSVHTWNLIGSRFESVEFVSEPIPVLGFVYSYLMAAGRFLFLFRQYATVPVPVPKGREEEAKKIVDYFENRKKQENHFEEEYK